MRYALVAATLILCGCTWFRPVPSIKADGASVVGVKDAGKPATLNTVKAGEIAVIPAGSTITVTETPAQPAKPATATEPASPAVPAQRITEIKPSEPMEWTRTETTMNANTGTVDTSVAQKRIDSEESRPLLYASIAAALAAALFVYLAYPTPAMACGIASVVFFMAWKVSGLPSWFWAVGLLACGVGAALYLGHERGEKSVSSTTSKPNTSA